MIRRFERRDRPATALEKRVVMPGASLRASEDGKPLRLTGYAAKFNVASLPLFDPFVSSSSEFVEQIAPGAFARTLKENPDIRALSNHDTSRVLGRQKNGSLEIREDETGLWFDDLLPNVQYGIEAHELVRTGYIDGCSFGFVTREDDVETRDGVIYRTLLDVDLHEVSIAVAFPAYESSTVAARSRSLVVPFRRDPKLIAKIRNRILGIK